IIIPTPSYLLVILDEFRSGGLDPSNTSLQIAFCGAEPWTKAMRAGVESAFDIDAMILSACPNRSDREWRANASKPKTDRTFGRITSIPRSSIQTLAGCSRRVNEVRSSLRP